jgi:uncharacterized protein (DUF58 family)
VESPTSIDPQALAKVRSLRVRARHIVEGYVAGVHRSPYQGFSIEFAEHREYVPGDDLRYVDWKVFGKSDKVYLKRFQDETNLRCYLAVDVSASMTYRGPQAPLSKLEYAQSVAAALAWLVLRQQDAVGLVLFDDEIRALIRPAGQPGHLDHVLTTLEAASPAGRQTAAGAALHALAQRWSKRGLVVVLSDLFDELSSLATGLKHLRYRRHDVVVLQVLDPAELEFPFRGPIEFVGLEGESRVPTDPQRIRAAYQQELAAHLRAVERICRSQQIDYYRVRTDQPVDAVLTHVLAQRQRHVG